MLITTQFEPIDPNERKAYGFDFSAYLDSGDTVSTVAWSVTVLVGTDASPSGILDGGATIVGAVASQFIADAIEGVTYILTARATTANGSLLELSGVLRCVSGSS